MKPTQHTVRLFAVLACAAGAVTAFPDWRPLWTFALGAVLLLLLLDLRGLWTLPLPRVSRKVSNVLPVGLWTPVTYRLENPGVRDISLVFRDVPPHESEHRYMEDAPLNLAGDSWHEAVYQMRPLHRGNLAFENCLLIIHSPWRLWKRVVKVPLPEPLRVYPNFQDVAHYALMATNQRLRSLGVHRRQRRGEGREFHQMREYVPGDPLRQIDWKASSRMRKLIAREYQDERNQQVLFLMDCGQSMRAQDDLLSHFDHALNAILLMTHVALKHGDAVGLMTFSGHRRRLSPRKGAPQLNLILNTVYDIQPGLETSDFEGIAEEVLRFVRKRTLIIIVTNLRDEDDEELIQAVQLLRRKHLVLVASMREKVLDQIGEESILTFEDGLNLAAAFHYRNTRKAAIEQLRSRNINCLDTTPPELPIAMINRYLDIKSKGLL